MSNYLSHIGDIIAIPFFILLTMYFYKIEKKSPLEWTFFLFCIGALIADVFFTYDFFTKKHRLFM